MGLIKTVINESIRGAIRGAQKKAELTAKMKDAAADHARYHMPSLEKSAVTRGDVAHVANKVEQIRQDMHGGYDDLGHLIKANADHVSHVVQEQTAQLSEQIGHLASLMSEHSSVLQDLIRVLEHFH